VPGAPRQLNGSVLIDLQADPMESTNIAESKPDVVRAMRQELEHWFGEVIQDPHAFTPTVFQIGWKGKNSSEVLAFGTSKTVGVKNNSHMTNQWDVAGDYAEYQIHVHEAGTYKVSLSCNQDMANQGTVMKVSCKLASAQSELEGNSKQTLGRLRLDAGEHTIKLEIASVQTGTSPNLQIKTLQFDRL
jgi:hypothetical protein